MEKEKDFIVKMEHTDIIGQPAINTIYWSQPQEHVTCPKCGEIADLDPEVLTSMPPQRRIRCPHCGYVGFEFCHKLHIFYEDENEPETIHTPTTSAQTKLGIECIICGETTEFTGNIATPHICPKCKKAILAVRKLLYGEE